MSIWRGNRSRTCDSSNSTLFENCSDRAGENDSRPKLGRERPVFPRDSQLAQKPCERTAMRALGGEIGHRVQPNVIRATALPIERIQTANRAVPLQNANALTEMGKAVFQPPTPTCRRQ